jgi:superfamily II DNA or RNA helicase
VPLADLLSQLDSRPGVRGRQFERLCAWYLRNAPGYRERIRKVWLWSEWSGAWAADAGIDLVAEERDGRLWAIQTKAYDPSYAIKKADVDSFLSESSRPQFSYRLLIATTDRLGPTARRTLDSQREPVGYLLRSQLELAQVSWPTSPGDLRPRRPPRKKPLPHVREAIKATVRGFADQERGQLIMACGTGKTLAALWIAERLGSNRTLVLVPSLSLLAQTLREWAANATQPFDYLAVCSDRTVVGEDDFVQHTAELGLPVTTDPDAIAAFLRRRGRRVLLATYQSSPQVAAAYQSRTPHLDLAIADEAHRCAGRASREFATILDDGRIKSRRRLFMTATPRFYTPRLRREAGLLDVEVASMDDESVFGPVLHRLTFGEAIERDLLSDYQVVVVGVDDETYRVWAERGEFVTRDGEKITDARTLAGEVALAKAMRKYDLRRVISFHSRVKTAREFSRDVPDVISWMPARARPVGPIWTDHVSGAMSSGHRDRVLLRFRNLAPGESGLLSNARCLSEGVDVPTLDGVAFIDPRRSATDIIQAVGRAIRKAPDKTFGTIVLPVFIANDADPAEALSESVFTHVWDVLKALRAHDDVLADELDELRRRLGARRGSLCRPAKIRLDLPKGVSAKFASAFDVKLVEQTTASWEFWLGLLERYVEQEGTSRVPADHVEGSYRLGQWINAQRAAHRIGELPHDRVARLSSLPGWSWAVFADNWELGFSHLVTFAERGGHARPTETAIDEGFPLGRWVALQRRVYRSSTRTLSASRVKRLEELPGWSWNPSETQWEKGFRHLTRFAKREGHAQVARFEKEDGFPLGHWVSAQRTARRRGRLGAEREALLEALPGWTWTPLDVAWETGFEHLARFVAREGHADVLGIQVEDGFLLGRWVSAQRQAQRKQTLDGSRVRRLVELPGWTWDPAKAFWETAYAVLVRFSDREGHARVPSSHDEDGVKLGSWVAAQRVARRRGQLSGERIARLEALPGWHWEVRKERWEKGFAHLKHFVATHRHARVPIKAVDGDFKLGQWVTVQRSAFRLGRLSQAQIARLENLPGWTWNAALHA